jgi:DNA-binding GntR family transcriptional regulator
MRHRRSGSTASLSEVAFQAIRRKILTNRLKPGELISRRTLAEELKMSAIPVTEALKKLEHEGWVESRARSGTRVRRLSIEDIRGHYVIREALECQAARLCAEKASQDELAAMLTLSREVDRLFGQSPPAPYEIEEAHFRLHLRIAQCTGCPQLAGMMENVNLLYWVWLATQITPYPDESRPHWHEKLVQAIASGDPARAEEVMRVHVRTGLEGIVQAVESQAENSLFSSGKAYAGGGTHRSVK